MTPLLLSIVVMMADDPGPGVAPDDLPAYESALKALPGPARPVAFGDLWKRPEALRGAAVAVEGRVVRRFIAPASGRLPARVEAWIATGSGDLICLVFPGTVCEFGGRVRFEGTSLGRVRYESGDGPRLAPLIVGPSAPKLVESSLSSPTASWEPGDWGIAAAALAVATLVLARLGLRRPHAREVESGKTPDFHS